jgi:hypothetical protein
MDNLEVKIEAPEGFEIDRDNSTLDCIRFKKRVIASWTDLQTITGYFTDVNSIVRLASACETTGDKNYNIFARKRQADASLALAQLSQLMKNMVGSWTPDWADDSCIKYVIFGYSNEVTLGTSYLRSHFLSFPTKAMQDEFATLHEQLIKKALPLL